MKTKEMAAKESLWAERLRAWRASGQSAPEFVQGKDYTVSSLRYWTQRLAKRKAVQFVQVVPAGTAPHPEDKPAELVLEVGRIAIRVARGFDPTLLKAVVQALSEGQR